MLPGSPRSQFFTQVSSSFHALVSLEYYVDDSRPAFDLLKYGRSMVDVHAVVDKTIAFLTVFSL
jgi:hypothetical protein